MYAQTLLGGTDEAVLLSKGYRCCSITQSLKGTICGLFLRIMSPRLELLHMSRVPFMAQPCVGI